MRLECPLSPPTLSRKQEREQDANVSCIQDERQSERRRTPSPRVRGEGWGEG